MEQHEVMKKTAALEKVSHLDYFNIAVSADCVIFGYDDKELKVLLIKSDLAEFEGLYSLLGDLVRPDEDLEKAPYRILLQRTGLQDVFLKQVKSFGSINRHPSGRVVTVAYYALLDIGHHKLKLADNDLHWHAVNDLVKMAFDHAIILKTCLQELKQQVMEHPVIFNLLPEKFSLRQLQKVYEAILGQELDRRNFRKKIALKNWLQDTDEMETDLPHRPGKLYQLKKEFRPPKSRLKS